MILDRRLGSAGDENEFLDAGGLRLFDRVLDQRFVDHRKHLFGHRLGRRQKPRTETADRENRFTNAHGHEIAL